jgi:hypothetical protein
MELEGGVPPASPMATPMRAITRNRNEAANPQKAVITDQIEIHSATMITRL